MQRKCASNAQQYRRVLTNEVVGGRGALTISSDGRGNMLVRASPPSSLGVDAGENAESARACSEMRAVGSPPPANKKEKEPIFSCVGYVGVGSKTLIKDVA